MCPKSEGPSEKESISLRFIKYVSQMLGCPKPTVAKSSWFPWETNGSRPPTIGHTLLTMECALQSHHIENIGYPAASTTPAAQMPAKKFMSWADRGGKHVSEGVAQFKHCSLPFLLQRKILRPSCKHCLNNSYNRIGDWNLTISMKIKTLSPGHGRLPCLSQIFTDHIWPLSTCT